MISMSPACNPIFLAAEPLALNLLSIYKPLLVFLTVLPYAWVISSVIESDARFRRLHPERWGMVGLGGFLLGLAVVAAIPWFWLGWPLMIGTYLAVPYAYWKFRDARVAAEDRFDLFSKKLEKFRATRRTKKAFQEVTASFGDSKGKYRTPPAKDAPNFETHLNVERMLVPSLPANSSRVELGPVGAGYLTVQTVDTVKTRRETLAPELAIGIIDYLKIAAGLDIKERRKRQTAIMSMKIGDSDLKFALTTWGASAGQSIRLELDKEKQLSIAFDKLGVLPIQTQTLVDALEGATGGVVLVLAPPGHGLTALAYALLSRHNPYTTDIKTIERQVDRRIEGVTQTAWVAGESVADYATTLQTIVRRGPDVMLVSDITDAGTGSVLTHGNSQNTLFYVLIPTDSVLIALATYLKAVGDPKAAVKGLRAVVAGRLVRKLCQDCRQPFQASADQAKRLGATAGKALQLHRASGKVQIKNEIADCMSCMGVGFAGSSGAYEILRTDDRAKEILIAGDISAAYQQMRRAFRSPLAQECALLKVRTGETSLEEIARVFAPKTAAPSTVAPAASPAPSAVEKPSR